MQRERVVRMYLGGLDMASWPRDAVPQGWEMLEELCREAAGSVLRDAGAVDWEMLDELSRSRSPRRGAAGSSGEGDPRHEAAINGFPPRPAARPWEDRPENLPSDPAMEEAEEEADVPPEDGEEGDESDSFGPNSSDEQRGAGPEADAATEGAGAEGLELAASSSSEDLTGDRWSSWSSSDSSVQGGGRRRVRPGPEDAAGHADETAVDGQAPEERALGHTEERAIPWRPFRQQWRWRSRLWRQRRGLARTATRFQVKWAPRSARARGARESRLRRDWTFQSCPLVLRYLGAAGDCVLARRDTGKT